MAVMAVMAVMRMSQKIEIYRSGDDFAFMLSNNYVSP